MATKVSLGFARLPDTELDNFAQTIIDTMTGNTSYPSPPVTMANLQTAKDDFTTKLSIAQTGGRVDTAAKNNSRQNLITSLRRVASYVQMTCDDNRRSYLARGFKRRATIGHQFNWISRKAWSSRTAIPANWWRRSIR
jgi:hypothetical protein